VRVRPIHIAIVTEETRAEDEAASASEPEADDEPIARVRRFPVFYDPPAETRRMALIFLACVVFSVFGLVLASRAHTEQGTQRTKDKLFAAAIALSGALTTMGVVSRRYRPGGGHARAIVLELTSEELRIWGAGYGSRIAYRDAARIRVRMVDTYLGRLGAMRQLRVALEGSGRTIEVATEAMMEDRARGLKPEGGEGDCVLLDRDDFEAFEEDLKRRLPKETRLA
jgi:hypothetical protein